MGKNELQDKTPTGKPQEILHGLLKLLGSKP
jgi:hypothetical protein